MRSASTRPVRRALLVTAAVVALVRPSSARAYRPFDSTDASVAARGALEIELGPVGFVREGSDRALVAPSLILNWGFMQGWELVLEGRHFVQLNGPPGQPQFKLEDTSLTAKAVLRRGSLQEEPGPSVATEFGVLLPTVHGEPGAGLEDTVIVSQRWTDLTVHLNGEVAWTRAHRLGLFAGAILEGHDAWAVRPVAEVFVSGERETPTVVSLLVGAIWRAADALSFDAGVRIARAGGVDTMELRAGLTWAFAVGVPR